MTTTLDPVLGGWWIRFRTTPNGPYFVTYAEIEAARGRQYRTDGISDQHIAYCIGIGKRCGAYRPKGYPTNKLLPSLERLLAS